MADHSHKPRRFRLSLTNAAEDLPRLISAWGRCCDGELAMVLRPTEGSGALVHIRKDGEARFWKAAQGDVGDSPDAPESPISSKEAVTLVKTAQKALPQTGPITLRGQWRGWLHCDGHRPRVELTRKLATYAVLTVESLGEGGWRWTVERTDNWFSDQGAERGEADTLAQAVERGLANAMGLLGQACSFRDSRRRAAFDEGWAETHPIKPAREGKDPIERIQVKEPKAPARKKAPAKKKTAETEGERAAGEAAPAARRPRKRVSASQPPRPSAAQRAPLKETQPPNPSGPADPEKDRLLMAAFADAVKSALAEV